MNLLDIVTKGATDRSIALRIIDETTGVPETGVVFNTSGIALWYRREGAAKVDITEATLAALTTAHTDGGFLHIADGEYRLDPPDAAFATGANYVDFGGTVTGMIVIGGRVRLIDINLEVANVPANVTQFGGSNGTFSSGRPEVNASHWGGTAVASAVILAAANIASDTITAAKIAANAITDTKIASGAFTAAKFASGAFDAVWTVTTRTLSSISGLASEIRSALGLATNNLDTQLSNLASRLISLTIKTGTVVADGSNSATTFETDLSETSTDHWKESFILITSGTLIGAVRKIDGYNGSTKFVTVTPALPSTPSAGVTFSIINR